MSLPDKVRIGCYDYKIILTDKPIIVNNSLCYGSIDYDVQEIEISKNFGEQSREATLWHEILHGIIHYRMMKSKLDEEELVNNIALGILDVLKNNKGLPGQGGDKNR